MKIHALSIITVIGTASLASAASISFVGSQLDVEAKASDIGTGWRNAATDKPLDIDSNDVIGTDGYQLFTTVGSLPSYVSAVNNASGVATYGPVSGYSYVDNPANIAGSDIESGTLYRNGISSPSSADMFSFTLQGTVPATVRVSLLVDNTDNAVTIIGTKFQLTGATGDSGLQSIAGLGTVGASDWYFVDIVDGQAGDVFTLSMTNDSGAGKNFQVGAIAFDSAVPEPVSVSFLAAAGMMLTRRRRV